MSLDEAALLEFVELELPEDLYLDYKQAWTSKSDDDAKRELLKDVTGFANSAGGHILIGVRDPKSGGSTPDRLKGVQDSGKLAVWIERAISHGVDPRIAGVQVKPVPLHSGNGCIVIHVPSSFGRPHMVNMDGPKTFHIRHTESTVPMSAHEVRESVLTSASAEARARSFVEQRLSHAKSLMGYDKGHFFLQAMPLIAGAEKFDVLNSEFEKIIRGEERARFDYIDLGSRKAPRPTIDGVRGRSGDDGWFSWSTDIHRSGYMSVFAENQQVYNVGEHQNALLFFDKTCQIFSAFAKMLLEVIEYAGNDVPYLMAAFYRGGKKTYLATESLRTKFHGPYEYDEIVWPEHIRAAGEDPELVAVEQSLELFHAYGLKSVMK